MKRVVKSKHFKRTFGLIAALVVLAAVIFVFTPPLLAPDLGSETRPHSLLTADIAGVFESNPPAGEIGEGVAAKSYLVFDEISGQDIAARNPNAAVAIASLTKLMTAYVVNKHGSLEDTWAINKASTNDTRPLLQLVEGDRVKVKDLVNAMLIGSANDAAAALGAYIASTEKKPILVLMNEEAEQLGMKSTHYENPIGFDSEQNYSTANDLKLLVQRIRTMQLFTAIDRSQSYSFTSEGGYAYQIKATNELLADDPEIRAIKTGFTDEAIGAMITAVHHGDRRFVMIILGSTDREADTKLLKSQIIKAF